MNRLDARTTANRENAKKSTGPKTEQGKARSRVNAFQHGLAGQGVAWPGEEQAQVDAFVATQVALERPQDEREAWLASRAAALAWQVMRADRIEAANARIRGARGKYDEMERREREVEVLVRRLETEPHRAVRSLLRTPEGCEWVLASLREFLGAVRDDWMMPTQNDRLDALCMVPQPGLHRVSRAKVLVEALCWKVDGVWPNGAPGLGDLPADATKDQKEQWYARERAIIVQHRPLWLNELREILRQRIAEVEATLDDHLAEPDPGLELAELMASFDTSAEGERIRRYQRANLRERRATLAELDAWRAGLADREARPEVTPATPEPEPTPTPEPEPEPEAKPEENVDVKTSRAVKGVPNDRIQGCVVSDVARDWLRSGNGALPGGAVPLPG